MKLEEVPDGGQIFVDANIFIYHFSRQLQRAASRQKGKCQLNRTTQH